jgi:hypothetical protein
MALRASNIGVDTIAVYIGTRDVCVSWNLAVYLIISTLFSDTTRI